MRKVMRIYRDSLPPTSSSTRAPWWLLRATLDPLVSVGVYLAAMRIWKGPVTQDDLFILCFSFALMFPGEIPFRRFSLPVARDILLRWLTVGAGVVLFWAAKMALLKTGLQADGNVIATLVDRGAHRTAHRALHHAADRAAGVSPLSQVEGRRRGGERRRPAVCPADQGRRGGGPAIRRFLRRQGAWPAWRGRRGRGDWPSRMM